MVRRIAEITYSRDEGLTLRFQPGTMRMMPEETSRHLRAANRELLLALRSVIDQAIQRTEQPGEPRRPRSVEVRMGGTPEAPGEQAQPS